MIKCIENIVERQIHDTYFLIDIKQNYLDDKCRLYEINETGSYIWNTLLKGSTVNDIVQSILCKVGDTVEFEELCSDVKEYIDLLQEAGFVEVLDGRN